MTKTLSAARAKTQFAETLRFAEKGGIVEITRYGRPVAAFVSVEQLAQLRRLKAAGPAAGLAGLVGRFGDANELAEALDGARDARSGPRPSERLDF
jgi:prevent-host-death family protein